MSVGVVYAINTLMSKRSSAGFVCVAVDWLAGWPTFSSEDSAASIAIEIVVTCTGTSYKARCFRFTCDTVVVSWSGTCLTSTVALSSEFGAAVVTIVVIADAESIDVLSVNTAGVTVVGARSRALSVTLAVADS